LGEAPAVHRHELTDQQWTVLEPLLPKRTATTGRTPADPRQMLNGIFWVLGTGAPWRDLPERYGPWQTVYDYFRKWRKSGVFAAIVEALQIKLDQEGKLDWELWCVDGASVRASRAAAGADKKAVPAMPQNPPTTLWAAAAAGLDRSSICLLTARALPWRSK
jgi:transposase